MGIGLTTLPVKGCIALDPWIELLTHPNSESIIAEKEFEGAGVMYKLARLHRLADPL